MGLILEKENEAKTIGELCKNKHIQPGDPNYSTITTIINDYFQLKQLINDSNNQSITITINQVFFPIKDPAKLKVILNRIKKWINAIQSSQPYLRRKKKLLTCQNFRKISINTNLELFPQKNDKINLKDKSTFGQYCNNVDNFFINKNKPQKSNNCSANNMNSDSSGISENNSILSSCNDNDACYNNTYIETGIGLFQRKNNSKFTERMMKGPPRGFIIPSWITISNIPSPRLEEVYDYYLNKDCNEILKAAILRDMNRTFSDTEYSNISIDYKSHLYHVIKAYANLDTELGYCQGMNFIVGFLLLVTNFNEEDSFYLLIGLFSETFKENINSVRGFYLEGFPLLLYFNYVFELAFIEFLPKLNKHFASLGIPLDVWAGRWFQTLFTVILPIEWCIRLWNCILVLGLDFMIKFTIALLQVIESDLLILAEEEDVMKYFKNLQQFPLSSDCENISQKCSIDKLITKAFKMNTRIEEKKAKYINEEQADFDEILDKIKIVYDLTIDMTNIKKCAEDIFETAKSCESDHNDDVIYITSPIKEKVDIPEIIMESNYENYNDDIEEMTIIIAENNNNKENNIDIQIADKEDGNRMILDDLDIDIDEKNDCKPLTTTNSRIVQNLYNHQLNIRAMKSDLDQTQLKTYARYNSSIQPKRRKDELKAFNTHIFYSAKEDH